MQKSHCKSDRWFGQLECRRRGCSFSAPHTAPAPRSWAGTRPISCSVCWQARTRPRSTFAPSRAAHRPRCSGRETSPRRWSSFGRGGGRSRRRTPVRDSPRCWRWVTRVSGYWEVLLLEIWESKILDYERKYQNLYLILVFLCFFLSFVLSFILSLFLSFFYSFFVCLFLCSFVCLFVSFFLSFFLAFFLC